MAIVNFLPTGGNGTKQKYDAMNIVYPFDSSYYDEQGRMISIPKSYISIIASQTLSSASFKANVLTAYFPKCKTIGEVAFGNVAYNYKLKIAIFPECETIKSYAFCGTDLLQIYAPKCKYIGEMAFPYCSLSSVSFPECKSVANRAFCSCYSLQSAFFPLCEYIGENAFFKNNISFVNFPVATYVGEYAFGQTITNSRSGTFSAFLPMAEIIHSGTFYANHNLSIISLSACSEIQGSDTFKSCFRLTELYLMSSAVVTLANSEAFTSTPIGGYSASARQFGSVYVPESLVEDYKVETNWTYFSDMIVGV